MFCMKKSRKRKNIKENLNLDDKKSTNDNSLEQVSGGWRPELEALGFRAPQTVPPRDPPKPIPGCGTGCGPLFTGHNSPESVFRKRTRR